MDDEARPKLTAAQRRTLTMVESYRSRTPRISILFGLATNLNIGAGLLLLLLTMVSSSSLMWLAHIFVGIYLGIYLTFFLFGLRLARSWPIWRDLIRWDKIDELLKR